MSLLLGVSQGEENSNTGTQEVRHVGSTYYPLGTKNDPVTANEYCAYLNSNDKALGLNSNCANIFNEPSFMNVTCSTLLTDHSNIRNNDCITRYNKYHWRYAVIPGRGDYIIDGLPWTDFLDWTLTAGEGFYPFPITEFNTWRKNPNSQEICHYLNKKNRGRYGGCFFY